MKVTVRPKVFGQFTDDEIWNPEEPPGRIRTPMNLPRHRVCDALVAEVCFFDFPLDARAHLALWDDRENFLQ